MMKEKDTSLNKNENGTDLLSKPSIVNESKLQNSLFAGTAASNAFAAQKLAQGSGVAAFFKNHDSLFSSARKQYDVLSAGAALSNTFMAQKLAQDSGVAAFFKNHDSLFSSARKQYDVLSAGAALSNTFTAQKLAQESGVAAFFKNHDSLFSSARKQYDALSAGAALSNAFTAQKLAQDSGVAAFFKNHDSLFSSARKQYDVLSAGAALSNAFTAQKLAQDSGVAAFFKKQRGMLTENYFATSVAKQLEKLNATEIQQLQEAAILFSRSPQGAAVIATNIHAVKEKEPDALTKLKNYIEESPITTSFRKLPLLLQIIIIYLTATISSVAVEKNKEIAMSLIEQAQQYVSKTVSPSSHVKKLTRQLPIKIDTSTLKYIRIITGENVRLRDKPSMQGDVLVTLEKYTPVIVIDQSDRKWLYVQLSFGNQKLYGWVNRSYTKAINH